MKKTQRLLEFLKPEKYSLILKIDDEEMNFDGQLVVVGQQTGKSDEVRLHSHGLKILSANINDTAVDFSLDEENDFLILKSGNSPSGGLINIMIKYQGEITDSMNGMYPCNFKLSGKDKKLIATQFESHHAREVLPCIDEPEAKAIFELTLITKTDKTHNFLSNTPISEQFSENGWTTTRFLESPKMSSYLLAFVFGHIDFLESKAADGTVIRTWATPDNVESTRFALNVAVKCLDFYSEYFKIEYPLEKCDMVALPDFAAGAMENWGLITYREAAMLVDSKTTSLPSKQWVALVVAHELAHQWFGNLVTMKWWTDLWLNEGFASWVEYLAIDKLFPEWNMWTKFVVDDFLQGQALDSLEHSHPIEVEVPDPDEIRNIFDAISYNKGASVIRMLHAYLGPEDFRNGLAYYLDRYKYSNASTSDLWRALEEESTKPIAEFMGRWTSQTGFPVLRASLKNRQLLLKQERFLVNKSSQAKKTDYTWPIPVDNTSNDVLFTFDDATGKRDVNFDTSSKLNSEQTGFFMVAYDKAWLKKLSAMIFEQSLPPVERLGLLNDQFQLSKAGYIPTVEALGLLDAYDNEDTASVWDVIVSQMASLRSVMDSDDLDQSMRAFLRELTQKQVDRLGWQESDGDNHSDKLLRPLILGTASFARNPDVVKEAKRRFAVAKSPTNLAANLRSPILGTVARNGEPNDYNKILKWYKNSTDAQIRTSLSGALSSFRDKSHIEQNLALIKSNQVRLQEVVHWISFMFSNRKAKIQAWHWLQNNWPWLEEKFGNDIMTFMYFPKIVGRAFSEIEFEAEFNKFFESVNTKGIQRSVDQGQESIQWQSSWRSRDKKNVEEFFKKWNKNN